VYEINGFPCSGFMFFLGTPFDPPRAGIIPMILIFLRY
jgi:hypothetical protein